MSPPWKLHLRQKFWEVHYAFCCWPYNSQLIWEFGILLLSSHQVVYSFLFFFFSKHITFVSTSLAGWHKSSLIMRKSSIAWRIEDHVCNKAPTKSQLLSHPFVWTEGACAKIIHPSPYESHITNTMTTFWSPIFQTLTKFDISSLSSKPELRFTVLILLISFLGLRQAFLKITLFLCFQMHHNSLYHITHTLHIEYGPCGWPWMSIC